MTEQQTNIPVNAPPGDEGAKDAGSAFWHPIETLRREVDRLFEDFDWNLARSPFRRSMFDFESLRQRVTGVSTCVDLVEREQAYEVTAELPGLAEANVRVEVRGDSLHLSGEKQDTTTSTPVAGYHLRERQFGAFERSFRLPADVDRDKIAATFEQGVLTVTLPRLAGSEPQARKIEIRAS
ncbi:MAG: Hsp20/alpha crystallin family protein [Gammaproteobacteria bacterium]|nr:Hsp20/alpha crystallin family protein [Gammaproteobacteria bacterium]